MTEIFKGTNENDIKKAAEIIRRGGIIAFPTETVYGLGGNAFDVEASRKIYAAKGRPSDNPMIVHISEPNDLKLIAKNITDDMTKLMDSFWPGPLTMIVDKVKDIPYTITGGLDTVGVRLPSDEIARKFITYCKCPIAAPSANISGKPSTTTAGHCIDDLMGKVDGIICGNDCKWGIESTVIDMTQNIPMILRPGIITKEEIESVLGKTIKLDKILMNLPSNNFEHCEEKKSDSLIDENMSRLSPKSPGMKYKHYSPDADVIIFEGEYEKIVSTIRDYKVKYENKEKKVATIIYDEGEEYLAARDFFARLRQLDKENVDVILVTGLNKKGVGFSVMNRMIKSAGYNIVKV